MPRLIIKQYKNLWKGHFKLDQVSVVQKYVDGEEKLITREILRVPDSVAVLLYRRDNGHLILTSQWRAPILARHDDNHALIEVCAGNIDVSDYKQSGNNELEAARNAACREVEEETGWHIHTLHDLFALYSSPGITTEKLFYFIASADEKKYQGGGLRQEGEAITVLEMDLPQALSEIQNNKIVDLKTVFLIEYFHSKKEMFI